jgi:hypothetical protein
LGLTPDAVIVTVTVLTEGVVGVVELEPQAAMTIRPPERTSY